MAKSDVETMIDQVSAGSSNGGTQITTRPGEVTVHWFSQGMLRKASGPTITTALEAALAEQGQR